eukprot:Rmarinus@m.17725
MAVCLQRRMVIRRTRRSEKSGRSGKGRTRTRERDRSILVQLKMSGGWTIFSPPFRHAELRSRKNGGRHSWRPRLNITSQLSSYTRIICFGLFVLIFCYK